MTDLETSDALQVPPAVAVVQSPATAAKLAFRSFTSLIPSAFSWSARPTQKPNAPVPVQGDEVLGQSSFNNGCRQEIQESKERCYVSKEKQLEKLRSRLDEDQRIKGYVGGAACGKRDGQFVNL